MLYTCTLVCSVAPNCSGRGSQRRSALPDGLLRERATKKGLLGFALFPPTAVVLASLLVDDCGAVRAYLDRVLRPRRVCNLLSLARFAAAGPTTAACSAFPP